MGVRGKLFSLAKVNATTVCEAIRAIEQLSATKGSGASHTCDVPQNDLPLSWAQIGSPENDPLGRLGMLVMLGSLACLACSYVHLLRLT